MNEAYRSPEYIIFLKNRFHICQRCGQIGHEAMHPPKRRPWNGGMGLKGADYGVLIGCHVCNMAESSSTRIPELRCDPIGLDHRDVIALGNLAAYAEHLDPGIDLHAECLEYAIMRVRKLEGKDEPVPGTDV